MSKLRVLIADDSALMRREIKRLIESDSSLEVVGSAKNGQEARELAQSLQPHVIILDINMPLMDGLTALQHIMEENPCPVIMLSSLTQDGAVTSYEALELGAIDFMPKPGGTVSTNIKEVTAGLIEKIKAAGCSNMTAVGATRKRRRQAQNAMSRAVSKPSRSPLIMPAHREHKIVLIGQSTGGPNTIMDILPKIPDQFAWSIFIIQHMPGTFTPAFAQRLDKNCAIPFKEIKNGDVLEPGKGYLAPGDIHSSIVSVERKGERTLTFRTSKYPVDAVHSPSVDVGFDSAAAIFEPQNIIAVLLTGMGADGAAMMARIRQMGGRTIAESEETAVVFGMPKEAIRMGGAEFILPSYEIGDKIVSLAQGSRTKSKNRQAA